MTSSALDFRSDIYNLGCIMFEIMSGRLPHQSESIVAMLTQRINSDLVDTAADFAPQYKSLVPIMLKCLQRQPEDRYSSLNQLHLDLTGRPIEETVPAKIL